MVTKGWGMEERGNAGQKVQTFTVTLTSCFKLFLVLAYLGWNLLCFSFLPLLPPQHLAPWKRMLSTSATHYPFFFFHILTFWFCLLLWHYLPPLSYTSLHFAMLAFFCSLHISVSFPFLGLCFCRPFIFWMVFPKIFARLFSYHSGINSDVISPEMTSLDT